MATMAPHFRAQQARLERTEARLEPLTRKLGILEDGLTTITNMLYPANDAPATYPLTNPLDPNADPLPPSTLIPTPDFRLPPATFPIPPQNGAETPQHAPPFDSQVHHLLTLHESLRDEVSRVAGALTELEGRTNMMVINESQRSKDEMLHTNAAINGMRMQLHWLMSATLQHRNSVRAGGTAGPNGSASASASGGEGSGGVQNANSARHGTSGVFNGPLRRLSDSIRGDTKL